MSALCQKQTPAPQQTTVLFDHLVGALLQKPRYFAQHRTPLDETCRRNESVGREPASRDERTDRIKAMCTRGTSIILPPATTRSVFAVTSAVWIAVARVVLQQAAPPRHTVCASSRYAVAGH